MTSQIVKSYKELQNNLEQHIKDSGLRPTYVASMLGMDYTTYYRKAKGSKFTLDEMTVITTMIDKTLEMKREILRSK